MKKDDLRSDPIRDNMLNALSFLRKNQSISAAIAIVVVSSLVFLLSSIEKSNAPDYSICYNIDDDPILKSFCEKDEIVSAISDMKADKGSNQYILSFLSNFSSKSSNDKLAALDSLDLSVVNSVFIKSELLKIHADLLVDSEKIEAGIEKYKQALTLVEEKKESSAMLNYKIALALNAKNQIDEANKYVDYAKECDHINSSLTRKIDILKSILVQTLSSSSK
tara:strand:+ start:65 stop:730 length:666 start_codon:yes stop_codon:yes gene_type:complete